MKYWFDTEFIEDSKTIELISIGIVSEDGREYYAENYECNLGRANSWVKLNVVSLLSQTFPNTACRKEIALQISKFCGVMPVVTDHKVEFWGDYCSYDWVVLCQLFGTMMDLPKGFPMYCNDIQQLSSMIDMSRVRSRPPTRILKEHHALNDALYTKEMYEYLISEYKYQQSLITPQ